MVMAFEAVVNTTVLNLIEKARSGSEDAFNRLMDQHMEMVYSVALRIARRPALAEDITQEVFIRVFRQLHAFRGESAFSTWLYRITVNQALRSIKKEERYLPFDDPGQLDRREDPGENPEDKTIGYEEERNIRTVIDSLPDKQRAVLTLRIDQSLPFKEIARILGRSVGGVKANYFHAIQKMKTALKRDEVHDE